MRHAYCRALGRLTVATWLGLVGVLASCGGPEQTTEPTEQAAGGAESAGAVAPVSTNPLAGTEWRLVEFQSMDDATGTLRPSDPSLFTMRLNADGSVNMRLDCNRANGSWSVEPAQGDPASGAFAFGRLASTRALCPPPRMDEQIVSQAEYVRSYLLKDGNLYLSLMADGGIYLWEPLGEASASGEVQDHALESALRTWLDGDFEAHYFSSSIDLNGDGGPEVVAYVAGPMVCGSGGCSALVLAREGDGYRVVTAISVAQPPIRVSTRSSQGWRNLLVGIAGGGIPAGTAELKFDGTSYPSNPTVPPAEAAADLEGAEILIPEFQSYKEGKLLPGGASTASPEAGGAPQ